MFSFWKSVLIINGIVVYSIIAACSFCVVSFVIGCSSNTAWWSEAIDTIVSVSWLNYILFFFFLRNRLNYILKSLKTHPKKKKALLGTSVQKIRTLRAKNRTINHCNVQKSMPASEILDLKIFFLDKILDLN